MCDVGARCPACGTPAIDVTSFDDIAKGQQVLICNRCPCTFTVTEPAPGLVMTRQDATYQ